MEFWMTIFMKPVFGVTNSNVAMKFYKNRGDVHLHSTNNCKSESKEKLKPLFKKTALYIHFAMTELNDFISATYDITINMHQFEVRPDLVFESKLGDSG